MTRLSFLLFTLAFVSCYYPLVTEDRLIEESTSLVRTYPDSALFLLNKIDTMQLSKNQKADYQLLSIHARDKAGYDISGDSRIFELKEYFDKGKDPEQAAKAAFYAARVYQVRGETKHATRSYLDVLRYEDKIKDRQLTGLTRLNLGILNYEQGHYSDAICELTLSREYFSDPKYLALISEYTGNAYFLLQEKEKALQCFDEALLFAKQADNPAILSGILQDVGVFLIEEGEYAKAKAYYRDALPLVPEDKRDGHYLNLGWIYLSEHRIDSAGYYAGKSFRLQENNSDLYSSVSLNELLYHIEKEKGNYAQALLYHEQYADSLLLVKEKQADLSLLEMQNMYRTELLEQDIMNKKQQIRFWIIISVLSIIICFLVIRSITIRAKKKSEEAIQKICALQEEAESFGKKENKYHEIVIQHSEILKKIAVLDLYLSDNERKNRELIERFNRIVYGNNDFDWDTLYNSISTLENGFLEKARECFSRHDKLTAVDFQVYCLSHSGLSQEEISLVLKLTPRNIQTRKTNIRTTFGIAPKGNITKFFREKFGGEHC